MQPSTVRAVIWDFDNTLVDTGARNRSVTRRIVAHLTGRDPDDFAALRDQPAYDRAIHATQNWQDLYADEFGFEPPAIRRAGRLWTEYQLSDHTPTRWFPGVADTIERLGGVPQGIVSLNTRENIGAALERAGMAAAIELIVGCHEVPYDRQKPSPEGLMQCIGALTGGRPGTVVYVGDHPVDAECAHNAGTVYGREGRDIRVVSVGASYGTLAGSGAWPVEPAYRIERPEEVLDLLDLGSGPEDPPFRPVARRARQS